MIKKKSKLSNAEKIFSQFDEYFLNNAACEKYKPLMDEMSEGVIVEDKNYNILYANQAFSKMIGVPLRHCTGRSVFDFMDDENRNRYIKEVKRGINGENPDTYVEISAKDQKIKTLISATLIGNDCHVVIMSDLRDLNNFSKKLHIDTENYLRLVQNSYKEMGIIKRKFDYISDLINFASTNTPLSEIFNFIVFSILAFTKADACVLRQYDNNLRKFVIKAANGVNADWYNKKLIKYKNSLIEKAIKSGGLMQVPDIQSEETYSSKELVKKNGFKSMIIAPIDVKTKLLGYVSLYFKDEPAMRNIDLDFLKLFLKQAAITIEMNS